MTKLQDNLNQLKAACENPRQQLDHYLNAGKKVIGCFAEFAPEELVHASGIIPMGLWGGVITPSLAKSYLPPFACPLMQSNMEFGLKGTYKGLSAAIIPTLCDTLRCMTQDWRFGVQSIPMIPIVYPQNRTAPAAVDYLVDEFETVLTMITTITGNMMSEQSLCDTIAIYNKHNEVMRDFTTIAADHLDVITPAVRHQVMKSAYFFEKSEHTAIVEEINAELKKLPVYSYPGKKVLLTGVTCEPDEVLDLLAENGLAVVCDDLMQESQQYRTDIPLHGGGAIKRLALQWMARHGCSLLHENGKPRGPMLIEMCKKNHVDGVINCMMKFCDPEEYDQPYLEKDLKEAGIPVTSLSIDQQKDDIEQLRTRIEAFTEML